ncbi:hypothetical protein LTR97_011672 [Elasticomyces elasticus]|uniref:DUF6594 domain-containing protein n=1 Tax=Elasticomyces elasticus TaxID=574655 RepID=A0AAN7W2A9_9PEZI|nr:hypothetical protein LTR97_011672 [Elasticomyces elasticus]
MLSMDEEREGGMYRRFRQLSTRNLLYMQAQLDSLENELHVLDSTDKVLIDTGSTLDSMTALKCAVSWDALAHSKEPRQIERMELIMKTRQLLKDYHEALVLDSTVARLPSPSHAYFRTFQRFAGERTMGGVRFRGPQFDEMSQAESLVTYSAPEADRLSRYINRAVCDSRIPMFEDHRRIPPSWRGMYFYSDEKIERVVSVLAVVLAAVLLIGGIAALDWVATERKGTRLGILAAFTTSFAILVGLLTSAKKTELFMATAGFTAVLVVYVGSAD